MPELRFAATEDGKTLPRRWAGCAAHLWLYRGANSTLATCMRYGTCDR